MRCTTKSAIRILLPVLVIWLMLTCAQNAEASEITDNTQYIP
jgi:hypothetical protein